MKFQTFLFPIPDYKDLLLVVSAEITGHQNHQMFKSIISQHITVLMLQKLCSEDTRKATWFECFIYYCGFQQESLFCLQSDSKKQLLQKVHSSLI